MPKNIKNNKEYRNRDRTRKGLNTYNNILQRCNNNKCPDYKYYGAKNIKCLISRNKFLQIYWRTKFCEICKCILNDEDRQLKEGKTIDRINPNGQYEKNNIRIICRGCNSATSKKNIGCNKYNISKKLLIN